MLESTVGLLGGLSVSALLLLIGVCIVGSTVAALRAVSRRSAPVSRRRKESTMAQGRPKDCRGLGNAALAAKDPDELLKIPQELNQGPKRKEQVRRDFREAMRTTTLS
jgi:hypothetical protein